MASGFSGGGPITDVFRPSIMADASGTSCDVIFYGFGRVKLGIKTDNLTAGTWYGVSALGGLIGGQGEFIADRSSFGSNQSGPIGYELYARGGTIQVGTDGLFAPPYIAPVPTALDRLGVDDCLQWCLLSGSHGWNVVRASAQGGSPQGFPIAASSSGATSIIAAQAGWKWRIYQLCWLKANGTVNSNFQSHSTTSNATGISYDVANTGIAPGYNPDGWFDTTVGEGLDINLSGSVTVGGQLVAGRVR